MDFKHDILPLKDRLFRLALRVTMNREESEDVVQDVLLRLWQKRNELSEIESIEAFALKIAYNRALDVKERMANKSLPLSEERHDRIDERQDAPDEALLHKERQSLVSMAIDSLPDKQRAVIQLRDIEGKAYKDIASMLDLSEADVKVTLFRARNKVRDMLASVSDTNRRT